MKNAVVATLMLFGMSAHADYSPVQIDAAALNADSMLVTMSLRLSTPCDRIASPQIVQDESNPMLLTVEGMVRKSSDTCIALTKDATQIVNLAALVQMAKLNISVHGTYVVRFAGFDGELVVPGNRLMISIQPQPIVE